MTGMKRIEKPADNRKGRNRNAGGEPSKRDRVLNGSLGRHSRIERGGERHETLVSIFKFHGPSFLNHTHFAIAAAVSKAFGTVLFVSGTPSVARSTRIAKSEFSSFSL